MRATIFMPWAVLAGLVLVSACDLETEVSGAQTYNENCAACHGVSGAGDGPIAANLSVAPPDLTALSARNGGVFPQVAVMSTIDGYTRGEHFAPEMPVFGDGDLGPTVIVETEEGVGTPVPTVLLALAEYLESIQVP